MMIMKSFGVINGHTILIYTYAEYKTPINNSSQLNTRRYLTVYNIFIHMSAHARVYINTALFKSYYSSSVERVGIILYLYYLPIFYPINDDGFCNFKYI